MYVFGTSAWHIGGPGSTPSHVRHGIFGVKIWLSTSGTVCILHESENHDNVGPISIWDVKEPHRTTSILVETCRPRQ